MGLLSIMRLRRRDPLPELEPGDLALAQRMLDGDKAAFEAFFEDHFPGLFRFALARVKNSDLARDLVQTAICKAIANLRSYRGEATLAAWLYTICRYEINGHFRRSGRRPEEVDLVDETPAVRATLDSISAERGDPEAALDEKEYKALVHATLDRLPPRYGKALEWKYIDELPVLEIAQRLQVGPKAAESILTRARKAFRDAFASFSSQGDPWRSDPI